MVKKEIKELMKRAYEVSLELGQANPNEYEIPLNEESIVADFLKGHIEFCEPEIPKEKERVKITIRKKTNNWIQYWVKRTGWEVDHVIRIALTCDVSPVIRSQAERYEKEQNSNKN